MSPEKSIIIKRLNLALFGLFICTAVLSGQQLLIQPKKAPVSSEKAQMANRWLEKPEHISMHFVQLDLSDLETPQPLILRFDDKEYLIGNSRFRSHGPEQFSWAADNLDGDGQIILSRSATDIQGTIIKGTDIYRLQTIAPEEYVILKINQAAFPPEKCLPLNIPGTPEQNHPQTFPNFNKISPREDKTTGNSKALLPYSCKLRLLVLYTPAAKAAALDIENTINLAMAETNQSFLNSDIPYEVELAYVGETNYTEESTNTDLSRFILSGDSFMDEVHYLRNTYAADICILINYETEYCGVARNIQVAEDEAFCVVNVECATGNFTFAHEIGHLVGCRHDTYVDGQGIPYPYGHGYVNVNSAWRTIMAYNNLCSASNTTCTRILQWSNPDISFSGEPTGTAFIENNARVWNENIAINMGFRESVDQVELTAASFSTGDYADVVAGQRIQTSGEVTIAEGTEVFMRASEQILLTPGFKAESGALLHAATESIYDCGGLPHPNLSSCGNSGNDISISGSTLEVTAQINNIGTGSAGSANIGFYLSPNITISTADLLLDTRPIPPLAPGASTTQSISVDLNDFSFPDGQYYVGYIVDYLDEVVESNEGDNFCFWSSPYVTLPVQLLPDLISCGRSGNQLNVDGNLVYVTTEIFNNGTVASDASTIGFYLSDNTEINTDDYLINTIPIGGLEAGASVLESFTFDLNSLSVPDGVYFVGFILDYLDEVTEISEVNNTCYWTILRVTLPVPELPDLNSCGNPGNNLLIDGSMLDATVEATNNGTGAADASSVGLYLSTNAYISTGDYLIGSGMMPALDAGTSGLTSISVDLDTVGLPSGKYYIGYILDYLNQVQEYDEFDNWCSWTEITIDLPIVDQSEALTQQQLVATKTHRPNASVPDDRDDTDFLFGADLPVLSNRAFQQVEEISAQKVNFNIFPNPATNNLNISFQLSAASQVSFQLQDVRGITHPVSPREKTYSPGHHQLAFSVNHLPPGLYFLSLQTKFGQDMQKVVIGK